MRNRFPAARALKWYASVLLLGMIRLSLVEGYNEFTILADSAKIIKLPNSNDKGVRKEGASTFF